jgi:CoA-dependent NAD(P)H sulfur oxidoreductase
LLHRQGTLEDLANLDLAYAPPFSSVWDPLQIAAHAALR